MSFALQGLMTGFAKGAKERNEKEREENEAIIQNRLKLAATNRTLRQKEMDAQQQLLRTRLGTVSSYLPEDATEEQKLALISNEEIAKQFVDLRSKGEEVDLNRFLILNKDKVPQNFSTVQQYIENIAASPAPVPQERIDALRQTRGFMGGRTGVNVEKIAQQFGASASELLAYEERSGVPMVPQFARMNVNMLRTEKTKDVNTRIKDAQSMYIDALEEFGQDSQEAKVALSRYENLKTLKEVLEPKDVKWADYVGSLKMAIVNAKTPQEREAAQREYNRVLQVERMGKGEEGEGKIPSANTLSNLFGRSGTRAIQERFGNMVGQNIIIDTGVDGSSTYRFIGMDTAGREKVQLEVQEAIRFTALPYLDTEGRPLNRDVEVALRANGVQFDGEGRAVFRARGPRREDDVSAGPQSTQNSGRTRTRAQIQAVATANNVSYEVAAQGARAQGYTIID
jgi:hypothetical protein